MTTKRAQFLGEKHIANMINVRKRRCRIGKVMPKSVAAGIDAFRRVLVESGIAPEDRFERKFRRVLA